ncbi:hypothetical protein Dda_5829 [Drechslerella dactyloides]|uniref:Homologous-pairing protein 2 winged helix domain-containing protein n=1 Tax=Drechslerella dactyloides TaxID=74499 RepID=A0AAD6IVX1_DREDA|nr:hypothetical protein Dda_5829 [Drechslerella dactyloides]
MAPKKGADKKEAPKAKGDEAVEMILDYLRKQNRPYSATDISANLHNAVTKANADPDDFASPEEIADMNVSVDSLKERTTTLKSELKALQVTLQTLRSLPTADDLETQQGNLRQEVTDLRNRLGTLRSGDVKPISAEEKQRVQAEVKRIQGLWVARKKWEKGFFDAVSDGMGDVNPNDLKENMGLEDAAELEESIAAVKKLARVG